ncbi:hypothetical protein [Aliivibrio fischeri]|uniref:hypothetical protein n=1 Tax=Aliivibrio fischeri TaxID=668 RepID=UPI001F29188E|nr:hypothetical protein [Aliivibrio fischeri]
MISNTLIIRDLSHNRKALGREGEEKLKGYLLSDNLCLIITSETNKYIRYLKVTLKLEYWRKYDFKRSLSTDASELGVMPHVVEKMLGHELGGVLSVYNKHDWLDEQLKAYECYAKKMGH